MSPKYEGPRLARPDEFRQMLGLINRIFANGYPGGIEVKFPLAYWDLENNPERHHVMTCRGRIVAHAGIYPLEFVIGDKRLLVGVIHTVCTHERHRGKGLMAKLLVHCSRWMRENGIPLSMLRGDAVRYGRFGWKVAGMEASIGLNRRSLPALEKYRGKVLKTNLREAVADRLYSLHQKLPYRAARSREEFGLVMKKKGRRIYTARPGGRIAAYCLVGTHGKNRRRPFYQVREWAGSGSGILSILNFLLRTAPEASIEMRLPVVWLNWWSGLLKGVDSWSLKVAPLGLFKVIDRDAVLKALGLSKFGRLLKRATEPRDENLARMLFGPLPPAAHFSPTIARKIRTSLPVPLFLYPSDHE